MAKVRTSVLVDELAGKAGSVVFVKSRVGTLVRPRVTPANPNTPAQLVARKNLTRASTIFRGLSSSQLTQWQTYASQQTHTQPDTGHTYHPTAVSVFVGLATKVLQTGGTVDATFAPPSAPYLGDPITISVSDAPTGLSFAASGSTSLGTKVEILLQALPSPNRKPNIKNMVSKAFLTFGGLPTPPVDVPPGIYGIAYRFVNTTTGQTTPLVMLPTTTVSLGLAVNPRTAKKAA